MLDSLPRNFVDRLCALATQRPEDIALVLASERDGAPIDTPITYRQLDDRVRALAAVLQQGFDKGERALLLLDNDDQYVVAFFACLYAGLIAVPVFPPESARQQHVARLLGIARDAQARCILTSSKMLELVGTALEDGNHASIIAIDTVDATADDWAPRFPADDDIAFLQYTSGSTSAPKGVMVSHGNLMANERAIEGSLAVGTDEVFVSWLPLYHDMGLIGGLLQPVYRGIKLVLMTPRFFMERPLRWLEAISRHRGTISGGPDFAYRLCLERVRDSQLSRLDLCSWKVAFSGAEPVRHDTQEAFIARFAEAGFSAGSVYPCYGLAEATLLVTGGQRGAGMVATAFQESGLRRGAIVPDVKERVLVACGQTVADHSLRIHDIDRDIDFPAPRDSEKVGEIWVSGPSIAKGYWNKPEETAEAFVERDGHTWLRTGDLGFIYHGQMYVAGRVKDLIIVRGHNLYPQDIERAIENGVDAVRKGRIAAFAVDGPQGEGIGVAVEVSRSRQKRVPADKLVEALGIAVSEACGEPLSVAVLLNPGALPKTSSGKLQRRACRQGWLEGSLDAYGIYVFGQFVQGGPAPAKAPAVAEFDALETEMAAIWAHALKCSDTGTFTRDTHFFAAGGNSLAATQAVASIEARWAVGFSIRTLFEFPRLSECAAELRRRLADQSNPRAQGLSLMSTVPIVPQTARDKPLPLSHAQQRLGFLWQLDTTSTAYHIQGALRLSGTVDSRVLAVVVEGLGQRHESLRTVFNVREDGEIEQRVQPQSQLVLQIIDLPGMAEGETPVTEALRRLNAEPFDLTRGALARIALIRLTRDLNILAMVMHHIIADGVSMQILIDELAARYRAAMENTPLQLPELPIQYADYAIWQRQWLQSGERERQSAYWRGQLGDEHQPLALPTDHPRPPVARFSSARCEVELPEALLAALRKLAADTGTTLFMGLLAGFQILLHRYTGQKDIRVGTPVANRTRIETQNVVGFFVNTLVLRNSVHGRMSLTQVLEQAREATLGAQANQDLPFEQLVEQLQPERSLSHNPLFQVMFNHLREDYRILQGLPGLSVTHQPFAPEAAQFELTLDTRENAEGAVRASFTYARELFEPATIERMAGHYLKIMSALTQRPGYPVAEVELLSDAQRAQLREWGVNQRCYPNAEPVHRLVERQVAQRPDAVALEFNGQQLSYATLNRRANQLAHHLIALNVKPETKVGIAVERSIEMLVGVLGIMKAGGAYVPLDPEYPRERLAYMIEDSGIEWLLTQSALRERVPADGLKTRLELDRLDLSAEPQHNPQVALHRDHLAYVIYTSGSTGKPKGVMVRHGSLNHFLQSMQDSPGLAADDVVVAMTSLSFDIAALELYLPLICGARIVLAGQDTMRDGPALAKLVPQARATVLQATPSGWRLLRAGGWPHTPLEGFKGLCGGEALPNDLAKDLCDQGIELWNMYGPTETTIWSAIARVGEAPPHLGRAIAATQARVLDVELNLVPPGVAGELYLGGAGMARGYLNRPALTSERFIADPQNSNGERLYRTGDLVRWNADGQLEYLGRIDHQVKIRGFRIELGEVEAQLLAQPEVKEAVVVARSGPGGDRLVGYMTTHCDPGMDGEAGMDSDTLRARLSGILPDYMIPSVIVCLDALPLTPNGKVNREALPTPQWSGEQAYEAPQGEVEEALAAIWGEVLGVEPVSRNDNFFALGGHSLLATQVVTRIRIGLRVEVPLKTLFDHPILRSLASHIGNCSGEPSAAVEKGPSAAVEKGSSAAVEKEPSAAVENLDLRPVARHKTMDLSPNQRRLWLVERLADAATESSRAAYNMAVSLNISGQLDVDILRATLNFIVKRHEILRTLYTESDDGEPITMVQADAAIELPVLDVSAMNPDDQTAKRVEVYSKVADSPFNLESGPILRARLLCLGKSRHVLVLGVHHIAFDGWSVAVFTDEFRKVYEALAGGERPALPDLKVQYADYAQWQNKRLDLIADKDTDFWQRYLDGAPSLSTLPYDFQRSTTAATGSSIALEVAGSETEKLSRLAEKNKASLFSVLLASFFILLHRTAETDDLIIGTDVSGRDHPDLEPLIGFFVNVVPIRSRLTGTVTFTEWLSGVWENVLAAFEHQHTPLDRIVETARLARNRQHSPLVQVLFVMQNTPEARFELPGLDVEVISEPVNTSKFDLAVFVTEKFVTEKAGGLIVQWVYSTELYCRETIERTAVDWRELLKQIAESPDVEINSFEVPSARKIAAVRSAETSVHSAETSVHSAETIGGTRALKNKKLGKLNEFAKKNKQNAAADKPLVKLSLLNEQRQLPIVIEALHRDLDAVAWIREQQKVREQQAFIESLLSKHGGILFRNFQLRTPREFEAFAEAIEPSLFGGYGDLPKKSGGRNIYQSTPYPQRQMILYHNESSHLDRWPRKQLFFCEIPSTSGGATPIVDCREMLSKLPPDLVREFERKGLLYVRTFTPRLDVDWRDFFKTDNPSEVEAKLTRAGIDWCWLDRHTLQTRSRCPAVITHPVTGDRVFFNQIQLHHTHCLEAGVRDDLMAMVGPGCLPRQVYYGDGTPIADDTMAIVGCCYEACAVRFDWRQGDVLMLDNMLVAHARDPFEGERKIAVAMGAMFDREALELPVSNLPLEKRQFVHELQE